MVQIWSVKEHWGHGYMVTDNLGQATPEGVNTQLSASQSQWEPEEEDIPHVTLGQEQRPDAPGADTHQAPTTARQGGGTQSEHQLQQCEEGQRHWPMVQDLYRDHSHHEWHGTIQMCSQWLRWNNSRRECRGGCQPQIQHPGPERGGSGLHNRQGREEFIPEQQPNRRNCQAAAKRSKKNTKVAIQVASLNMKRWKSKDSPQPKWFEINQMMHEKCIGILLVQEVHMDGKRRERVEDLFKKSL
ncbi:hypothetical protein DFH08DRAFT_799105 [Mycena albidolilacea]|uniref:Uncharacterized protein n=1 Tax=Mycena albidolilacea TaxID=1033008 RepID=A0AAD7F208_9AGAR|nr:hypothetical protein DFH08DRAFT_799105 [Mycena albidolilacea]